MAELSPQIPSVPTASNNRDLNVPPPQVQRQHEEAVKEVNQAMSVRIKASKDLKRLTEERNAAMQVGVGPGKPYQTMKLN